MSEKDFIYFGEIMYLQSNQNYFLFSRGFIDSDLHLSTKKCVECEFIFQQKNMQIRQKNEYPKKQPIAFGTEITIKHVFSNYYLSMLTDEDGHEKILLQKDLSENSMFEMMPLRTFQHKGDHITMNSSFAIRHILLKSYIGSNILEINTVKSTIRTDLNHTNLFLKSSHIIRKLNMQDFNHPLYDTKLQKIESSIVKEEVQNREKLFNYINEYQSENTLMNSTRKLNTEEIQNLCFIPIEIGKNQRANLMQCALEKHSHTMWKAQAKSQSHVKYLQDNDYIYFVSSIKNKGAMTVTCNEDSNSCVLDFVSQSNEFETECSAIFIVEIQGRDQGSLGQENIYLKHLLSGRYFPFNEKNMKKKLKLVPLLPVNNLQNKLPPFHIYFQGQFFPKQYIDTQDTCGFWLNKVDRIEINQILSLQGISYVKWIPYLSSYLDRDRTKRQQLLKQFGILKFMVYYATNKLQQTRQIYNLLFKMINQNKRIRKQIVSYISELLKKQKKQYLIDILSEIFNNQDNFIEKYIQPEHLNHEINDFKIQQDFSITYLRIFRLFCGNYSQPCQRNQNLLYKLFFQESSSIGNQQFMSQSILHINQNKIPQKFKFKLVFQSKTQIQIENSGKNYQFKEFESDKQSYLRQYFYLLGDCLKKNKSKIEQFKKSHAYTLQNLLDILENKQIEQLHGPILNLINIVYLDPEYKYKLYVYISGYDQMCYKGSLISLQQSEDIARLISFINVTIDQLEDKIDGLQKLKKDASVYKEVASSDELLKLIEEQNEKLIAVYTSTKFKRFLITIKHTIKNSYWNNINSLQFIVDTLYKLYITKTDKIIDLQSDYEQVHEWKNYLDSTVLIIDIAIIYLDIKINLCISNLITLTEDKVQAEINSFVNDLEINQFHKHLDYFQFCDAENEETMRRSLILSRKYYEIKSIVYTKYNEAMLERRSTVSMKDEIEFIRESIEKLKANGNASIEICKQYISRCLPSMKMQDLNEQEMLSNACILISNFKYKKIKVEFQILSFKLGVLEILTEDIERYINLRAKQKVVIQESIYWKLLLLNILIKSNLVIKKQIVEFRKLIIQLIVEENANSLIAIDILEQLYSNNRAIVVSDRQQIQQICLIICELIVRDHTCEFSSKNIISVKINKLFNLVLTFLIVNGKKIKNNFSLIAGQLFDKEVLIVYLYKIKNIENQLKSNSTIMLADMQKRYNINNDALFQVLLYILTETLEQKPEKLRFTLPQNDQIMGLILAIGRNNWKLTFEIYNLIKADQVEQNDSLLKMLRVTLNSMCEIALEQYKSKQRQYVVVDLLQGNEELQIIVLHLPIIIRIVRFIMEVSVRPTKKKLVPQNLSLIQQTYQRKRELIERLFLFKPYLADQYSQILQELVRAHMMILNISEDEFERMKKISFKDLTMKMIRQANLGQIVAEAEPTQSRKGSFLRGNMSKRQSNLKNNQNIFQWIQQISRITKMKSIKYFEVSEAKQFIKSLIFINRSDANYLDTGLKQFFLSFLINSFPEKYEGYEQNECYLQELQKHQKLLVDILAAELISILLQQKFKQNYNSFINIFQFGNKLLEGGNEHAQMRFYDIFLKDHKNCIFENITFIIENSLMGLKFYFRSNGKQSNGRITLKEPIVYPQRNNFQILKQKKNICEILKKIFRFLQLLCENDNQELKKYIFRQTNDNKVVKYMSVNFLEIAINIYIQLIQIIDNNLGNEEPKESNQDEQFYAKQVIDNLIDIQIFIVDFLIEVCQYPAFQNQFFICQTDFFYSLKKINDFSKIYYQQYQDNKIMFRIERKITILLRGLLEQKNNKIIQSLNKKLHFKDLQDFVISSLCRININTRAELIQVMSKNHDKLVDQVQNVVDILIVCNALEMNIEKDLSFQHCEIIFQIKKQIKQIQVNFKSNLTTLYFCYRPIFNYLSNDTKEYFINKFSLHQSSTQKLKDLINLRHIINQDIIHRKSHQLIMSDRMINFLFRCSTYLCFILIALQLFFYSVTNVGITLDQIEFGIIKGLSYIQFMISLIYFVMWGLNIGPITKQKIKTKYSFIFNEKQKSLGNTFLNYYVLIKQIYWEEGTSYHALLLIFISFVSCFYEMRLYSLVVLYIFAKIQLLQSLLSAIRLTGGKLLLMCLLSSAFNFVFGILSINNYIKAIFENQTIDIDIQHISSHCSSILTCIESLYTQRIIGETPNREGDTSHYGRFFSDVVYWAFFDILIPNLTAAIIIDRFAELRNIKQKIEKQEHNACLICFADKSTIERRNQDFDNHKETKHCIWNYFFYLYYLQKLKSNTEYTGVEYWIIKQVKDEKVQWFPIDKSQKAEQFSELKLLNLYEVLKKKFQQNKSQFSENIDE